MEAAFVASLPSILELVKIGFCLICLMWYRVHRKFPSKPATTLAGMFGENIVEFIVLAFGAPAIIPLLF